MRAGLRRTRTWDGRLARLSLRRTTPPGLLAGTALLLGLLALRSGGVPDAVAGSLDPAGIRREVVWSAFALAALPLLLVEAAGLAQRYRRKDADWCSASGLGPLGIALSLGAGLFGGALALVLLALGAAELGSAGDAAPLQRRGVVPHPGALLAPGDAPVTWPIDFTGDARPRITRLELRATSVPGRGPSADLGLTLVSDGSKLAHRRMRIDGPALVRLAVPSEIPSGTQLVLTHDGGGALLALPKDPFVLLSPAASSRLASARLALRLIALLCAALALAAGLGAWMRPALAATLVLALTVASVATALPVGLPGAGELPSTLARLAEGRVPALATGALLAPAAACVLAGGGLFVASLRRGRSPR